MIPIYGFCIAVKNSPTITLQIYYLSLSEKYNSSVNKSPNILLALVTCIKTFAKV